MKARAVLLYGKNDLRTETIELPEIRDDELLCEVVTDTLCMSTYKAMLQGGDHRCVPDDVAENPIIAGHEFCGRILRVGAKWKDRFRTGEPFAVQPKMYIDGQLKAPGYSYRYYGGDATKIIIPGEAIEGGYVLPYRSSACYKASTAEPISCLVAAIRAHFHLAEDRKTHVMGLKEGGSLAIVAGCGPMGLGAAQVAMALEPRPKRIVIADIDESRVERARKVLKDKNGVRVIVLNTANCDARQALLDANGAKGYDDVIIMAPVPAVIETADAVAGEDSCLNFFAGPTKKEFFASVNFYDVHYNFKHIIGTSGGETIDMIDALKLIESGAIDPSILISHVGGLNAAAEATRTLPGLPGAKKLIYCNIDLPLTALDDFEALGKADPLFRALYEIVQKNNMLWCEEAERYLLEHGKPVQ
ncbi:zinc-binding dehydrogenase [Bacillota bacterium Meth-B3]|nr:zinc-binding dehydrogenase [Christensenellaceae bacterium]MEA5068301.1 zinc-binding dehydrogenase [Christensenellaceae bacterium]